MTFPRPHVPFRPRGWCCHPRRYSPTSQQTIIDPPDGLPNQPIEKLTVNTLRTLSMDAVQAVNSGHPGTQIALSPVMYTVLQRFLRYLI